MPSTNSSPIELASNAPHPFDNSDGDVIIRSSDNVDFQLLKCLLSLASPVFRGMFELPLLTPIEETRKENPSEWKDGLPIVPLSEDSSTLTDLLLPIFPWETPSFTSLKQCRVTLEVAEKYQMDNAREAMDKTLAISPLIQEETTSAYAIACRFGMERTARATARSSLRKTLPGEFLTSFTKPRLLLCTDS
ncbi:hypothetical protein JAAARDRAFT_211740 [Jaapia argillacea MUCL 33604]|uniref:BTB domain-containing protein n=1 Tax=Jaapia argillacea MUCL 33604 TaxID=933084 RepID=A0A067PJ22_9AGAM|nr:hypothetical protein JAAARDRAFT_211740 [Jaapia argillacea MUCL 33604]